MHINMFTFARCSKALCIGACLSFLIACKDDGNSKPTAGEMAAGEVTADESIAGEVCAGEVV